MTQGVAVAHSEARRPAWLEALRRRPAALAIGGLVALAIVFVAGIAFGYVTIPVGETIAMVAQRLGVPVTTTWSPADEVIVFDLRLPRVITAMAVGVALSLAGVAYQGLLRNPLADPYVLGTASGAALGAAIGFLLPIQVSLLGFGLVHILAFSGALLAVTMVPRVSRVGGSTSMTSVVLTGYAVGSLLAAGLAMAMYVANANLRQIFFYLLGSFALASWQQVAIGVPIIVIGSAVLLTRARSLNAFLLGEDAAASLGINVSRERLILLGAATLVTAAGVALSGLIGFVGLVVPHVVRLIVGPNARLVLPLSAIYGAAFLALADLIARIPGELPVGIVTALIGAPFFLYLLRRYHAGFRAMSGVTLEIRHLDVAYGSRQVLHDLSLSIAGAEMVALIGPNGAGKSTVLRCVTGLIKPRSGDVLVDGESVARIERQRLARTLAVVPGQTIVAFPMRVEELVGLGRVPHEHPLLGQRERDKRAVDSALARVGISDLRDRDVRELSLGERQLAVLAMAVAQEARILLLDEPTVHLDLRHQVAVMDLLRDLSQRDGVTVLSVMHDIALVRQFFDRLVLLDHGRLVADGPPSEVLSASNIGAVYGVDPGVVLGAVSELELARA